MSKLSRGKIAYDLNASPYTLTVKYKLHTLTYAFSSQLYRDKFDKTLKENRLKINESLSKRFGFVCVCDEIADLRNYATIEKRGFLIYKGLVKFECLNDIIFDGQMMMKPN